MPFHRGVHSRVLHKEVSLKMRNRITVDEISVSLNKKGATSDHKVEVRTVRKCITHYEISEKIRLNLTVYIHTKVQ